MILYPHSCSAMGLLLTCAGSAIPRAVVPAVLSASWAIFLELIDWETAGLQRGSLQYLFENPYPYQVFAYMLGVGLAFRTNVAYSRYWGRL